MQTPTEMGPKRTPVAYQSTMGLGTLKLPAEQNRQVSKFHIRHLIQYTLVTNQADLLV